MCGLGAQVVNAKNGGGSATLSMAAAAARFAHSCLRAQAGEANILEYAFVQVRALGVARREAAGLWRSSFTPLA